jgi:hypothetical protein
MKLHGAKLAAPLRVWQFGFEFKVTILTGKAFSLLKFRQARKEKS